MAGDGLRVHPSVGAQWLADGSYYLPRQLAGPYVATLLGTGTPVDIDPPSALLLFEPLHCPACGPLVDHPTAVGWCVASWRPAPVTLAVCVALLLWPRSGRRPALRESDIWIVAAIAAGLRFGWPAILVTIKPTLPCSHCWGSGTEHGGIAAVMSAILIVALPLWIDYVTALRNASIPLLYSLGSLPLMAVPLVAWATRRRAKRQTLTTGPCAGDRRRTVAIERGVACKEIQTHHRQDSNPDGGLHRYLRVPVDGPGALLESPAWCIRTPPGCWTSSCSAGAATSAFRSASRWRTPACAWVSSTSTRPRWSRSGAARCRSSRTARTSCCRRCWRLAAWSSAPPPR